jgi:hypothetical protein
MNVKEILGSQRMNELTEKYNGDVHSINLRKIDDSEIISNHSYGLSIDIYPKGNPYLKNRTYDEYKGDREVISFIKHVTRVNITSQNKTTVDSIVNAQGLFLETLKEYDLYDLIYAFNEIDEYNKNQKFYRIENLNETNPIADLIDLKQIVSTGIIEDVDDFILKLKLLNDFLNDERVSKFITFSNNGINQLNDYKNFVEKLYLDLEVLENNIENEEVLALFESINHEDYSMPEISEFLRDYENLENIIEQLGHDSFLKFALEIENWQYNRFNNNLFKDGFCDLPLDLIEELLYQENMEWGGTWHSVLDYMHFEIPKRKVIEYLDNDDE